MVDRISISVLRISITVILFSLIACSPAKDDTYTVEEIDGIRYVHNHAAVWGDEPAIELEFVQKIGILEGDDSNYMLYNPNNVAVDESGDIYICDSGNYRIQVYSSDGTYKRTIGRYGQGPGEMPHWPHAFDINGNILYVAHNNSMVHKFTTDGNDLGKVKSPEIYLSSIRSFSNGDLIARSFLGFFGITSYEPDEICLLSVFSSGDGSVLRKIGDPIRFENAHETREVNNVFPEIDREDNIYAAFESSNRLDKYTKDGKLIFSADRPLNYEVLEKAEWFDSTGKMARRPRFTRVSSGISIDSKERIWILTVTRQYTEGERQRMMASFDRAGSAPADQKNIYDFHVFDKDGIFLGSIPLPVSWLECKLRIFGDRLFLIEREQESCVHEYRIIDN
ncbi:MAG: hypothetical protein GY863_17960 [bacterium]|nr:hypothetical protein [bacterium]